MQRLHKGGFDAFLVGGSVRDLLLRNAPKDFDIVTDALPEQIRRLFRNCRLIGRRFRLAHILFGREIIEVATFRSGEVESSIDHHRSEEGMILRDNVYGDIISDAWRRDFTINALYYNIADFSIVDYTGGMQDIADRTIRLIGDPVERFREDPVRMLRAIRFASKLDFNIDESAADAIQMMNDSLELVSSSRLFEEINKIFQSGNAMKCFQLLKKISITQAVISID